jgi:hypothetical protein
MPFDLTADFVREYEALRRKVDGQAEPGEAAPPPELLEEIKLLNFQVQEVEAESRKFQDLLAESRKVQSEVLMRSASREAETRQYRDLLEVKDKALEELRARFAEQAKMMDDLKRSGPVELDRKDKIIRDLTREMGALRRQFEEARAGRSSPPPAVDPEEMARLVEAKVKTIRDEMGRLCEAKVRANRKQMALLYDSKVKGLRGEILADVGAKLEKVNRLPWKTSAMAFAVDVSLLTFGAKVLLENPPGWSTPDRFPLVVAGVMAAFSLRTFLSPGRILLGISPRRIGPDFRPAGPARFLTRLSCGILHYAPLIVTAYFVASDEPAVAALEKLRHWAANPGAAEFSLSSLAVDLFRPSNTSVAGVLLALTLAWWGSLALSILLSPLIHRGTPYFSNTTFVEWMGRVGFERFPWPRSTFEEVE